MTDWDRIPCMCMYCNEARWLKGKKPSGIRRMLVILHRHHWLLKVKEAAAETATV